jgi:hypothetical protein
MINKKVEVVAKAYNYNSLLAIQLNWKLAHPVKIDHLWH